MASKYLQKYPVPQDFHKILNDFAKEVLRSQPEDIIQFSVSYFDFKVANPEGTFHLDPESLKYNIAKKENPKQYEKTPYDQIQGNIQRKEESEQRPESVASQQSQGRNQQQQDSNSNRNSQQQNEEGLREVNTSKQSAGQVSQGSDVTHPEEKQVTKDFMGNLYNSAVQQTVDPNTQQQQESGSQQQQHNTSDSRNLNDTTHPEEKQEAKQYATGVYEEAIQQINQDPEVQQEAGEFQYEGPVEEYEEAALKIQKKFRAKQR